MSDQRKKILDGIYSRTLEVERTERQRQKAYADYKAAEKAHSAAESALRLAYCALTAECVDRLQSDNPELFNLPSVEED